MSIGGSLESIIINGREFPIPADVDANVKLGGFENDVQANGNGSGRLIKTRTVPSFEGLSVSVDFDRGDHEFLQEVADSNELTEVALTYVTGVVVQGLATITGDLAASTQSATVPLSMMGVGKFSRQ